MARDSAVANVTAPPPPGSKLPKLLRFPLLVITSLSLSALLYTFVADAMGYELASVSRSLNEDWQVAAILGWKVLELAVGWFANFDDLDLAALTTLTHAPPLYLLHTFYDISPRTILCTLLIDILTINVPTRLLRPRAAVHNPNAPRSAVPNRAIINASPVMATTSLLSAGIYAVIMYAAQLTWLPKHLIVHFDGLRTLTPVYNTQLLPLVALMLPVGYAARAFLLTPSLGAQTNLGDITSEPFNPATASLKDTVKHNVWGWSKKTRVLLTRSAVLIVMLALNTLSGIFGTIEGSDLQGSLGYATIWLAGGLLSAVAFGVVGDV